jgi:replicative DNA helicase
MIDDLDLRVLKAICTDKVSALTYAYRYDHTLFDQDTERFAKLVLDYTKHFRAPPTKRTLLDRHKNNPHLTNLIEETWNEIDEYEYDLKEYSYDLEQLKQRYRERAVEAIRERAAEDDPDNPENPEEYFNRLMLEINRVTSLDLERTHTQKPVGDYIDEFQESYEARKEAPEDSPEILTRYSMIDSVYGGASPGELLMIGGETAAGKMLPLETLIPTPNGFKENGSLKRGDKVFGRDGKVYSIIAESNIELVPGWKFIFNDGSEVVSHDNHEWLTFDRKDQVNLHKRTLEFRERRKLNRESRACKHTKLWLTKANRDRKYDLLSKPVGTIRTTKEIVQTLFVNKNKRRNHAIPISAPIDLPEKKLLIDPYLLGCWLGDGTSKEGSITSMDQEIIDSFINAGYTLIKTSTRIYKNGATSKASTFKFEHLKDQLRDLNVFGNKHIPHDYLWASKRQRLALLQGLMDTDGFVSKDGKIDFVNTNEQIANGVAHLVRSLGMQCTITKGNAILYGRITGPKWTVRFSSHEPVFRLTRKLKRQTFKSRLKFRYIVDAIRVSEMHMKCIQVDSPDHLYLCTENFIPTHNSMLLNNMAKQIWMQGNTLDIKENFDRGYNVLYFSLEMPYQDCFVRFLASLANVPQRALAKSQLTPEEEERVKKAYSFIKLYQENGYYFDIVDVPRNLTIEEVELRYHDAMLRYRPEIVIVDYMGLMHNKALAKEQDWLKMGAIAASLHEFARAYDCVVITAAQLTDLKRNSTGSQEEGRRVGVHRWGRSSLIMHNVNLGIQIETRPNEMSFPDLKIHVVKNRKGPLGKGNLVKNFANASLVDVPYDQHEMPGDVSSNIPALIKSIQDAKNKANEEASK